MQWHHVELIHFDLLRILHWAETDMDEEVTELISVRAPGRLLLVSVTKMLLKCRCSS